MSKHQNMPLNERTHLVKFQQNEAENFDKVIVAFRHPVQLVRLVNVYHRTQETRGEARRRRSRPVAGTGFSKVLAEIIICYLILCVCVCASVYGQHGMSSTDTFHPSFREHSFGGPGVYCFVYTDWPAGPENLHLHLPALGVKTCTPEPSWGSNSPVMCVVRTSQPF